jgi:hypothetical protein
MRVLSGYVVSRGGILGVVKRQYLSEDGKEITLVQYGPLGWLAPFYSEELYQLNSVWETDARKEAELLLRSVPALPGA